MPRYAAEIKSEERVQPPHNRHEHVIVWRGDCLPLVLQAHRNLTKPQTEKERLFMRDLCDLINEHMYLPKYQEDHNRTEEPAQ